jgi:hypothetical protein
MFVSQALPTFLYVEGRCDRGEVIGCAVAERLSSKDTGDGIPIVEALRAQPGRRDGPSPQGDSSLALLAAMQVASIIGCG